MTFKPTIRTRAYEPATVKAMQTAFSDAWSIIADDYSERDSDGARYRLADALLALADDDFDAAKLVGAAVNAMRSGVTTYQQTRGPAYDAPAL